MKEAKPLIKYEDFAKIDMRVGTVIVCEKVEKSDKLLRLEVDFGELGKRQILTGLAKWFTANDFVGKQFTFVLNMEPRKMMGLESQGMILGVGLDMTKPPALLVPKTDAENGDGVC